jgi:hypothetical protein
MEFIVSCLDSEKLERDDQVIKLFKNVGLSGLRNRLTKEENKQLVNFG